MKRLREFLRAPVTTGLLFLLAAVLLVTSSVGGTRAALQYFSEDYISQVEMYDIGVSLVEKSNRDGSSPIISARNFIQNSDHQWNTLTGVLLENLLPSGTESAQHVNNLSPLTVNEVVPFEIGKTYTEELSVMNSGTIDQFVRVTVYRYWVDVNPDGTAGAKRHDLDPRLIELHFLTGNGWTVDESASTAERTVLYYSSPLGGSQSEGDYPSVSAPFMDALTVNMGVSEVFAAERSYSEIRDGVTYRSVTDNYVYDRIAFQLDVQVDAVQTHNAADAKTSAWGEAK